MAFLELPLQVWLGQIVLGLVNGSFYAVLSMGLAIIFGLLGIVNFVHGAMFMLGAYVAFLSSKYLGVTYGLALILAPLVVGGLGVLVERLLLRRLSALDHLYGMILTFGLTMAIEGTFRQIFGVAGQQYAAPQWLTGAFDLGFMRLPVYRVWVVFAGVAVCLLCWVIFERTRLGAMLRAATENAKLTQALGLNVPIMVMLTYGAGVGLAGFAGVLAAPIMQVNPLMGSNLIIVVFAVVVIGGMGSVIGALITGLSLGVIEGLTKAIYPQGANLVIFVVMALVLIIRPAGLFGKEE